MYSSILRSTVLLGCTGLFASQALPYTELQIADTAVNLTPGRPSHADKARIFEMPDGTVVVFWHAQNGTTGQAWDLFGNAFAPRDIYVRTSTDRGLTWSEPVNISDTAGQTDPNAFYDRVGDGSGLANFYGDSDKPTAFVNGSNVVVTWSDTWCGPGLHGPARYDVAEGRLEVPFRCLYAARMTIAAGAVFLIAVDRITDATRDETNEVLRGTGAGFAIAWQEDPSGLELGDALGEGDGSSGARVSPGTDIWYTWIAGSAFANPAQTWRVPVPVSDNFDYGAGAVTGGGASRPLLALAGSPPVAVLVYEEAKNAGAADPGKFVIYHQFAGSAPPQHEPGTVVSDPAQNARRARVMSQGTPGALGTRLVVMWRQGIGIMGAPADVMMRVGRVPAGTSLQATPGAGFRVEDLWPAVDATDPAASAAALNLSAADLGDPSSVDPFADAKAHRAVLDGDVIFAGYTLNPNVADPGARAAYYGRWSDDGGSTFSAAIAVAAPGAGGPDVVEPRLLRTPAGTGSGDPGDQRNPDVYLFAWGTQTVPDDGSVPVRDSLYLTRSMDRGSTLEPIQTLDVTKTAASQKDEQIQLKVTPDGQDVAMVWVRFDGDESSVWFATAAGVTRTADLSITAAPAEARPDIGSEFTSEFVVANAGPDPATGTRVAISADPALAVRSVSASAGTCLVGDTIECSPGTLAAGASMSIALVLVTPDAGVHELLAAAAALEAEPTPADNDVRLLVEGIPNADLSLAVSAGQVDSQVGDDFVVDFAVANGGPQPATDVRLVVTVPPELRVTSTAGCPIEGQRVDCGLANLAPGGQVIVRLLFGAERVGRATVAAEVAANEKDPAAANDTAEVMVGVRPVPGGGCVYRPGGGDGDTLLALLLALATARLTARFRSTSAGALRHA